MGDSNKPNSKDYGFACRIERESDGTVRLKCETARVIEGKGDHHPGGIYSGKLDYLRGLTFETRLYPDKREEGCLRVEYRDRPYLDRNDLEEMVKVLQKIDKGIARLRKDLGYERGIVQHMARAANVLGFGRVWIYRERKNPHESDWEVYNSIGEGADAARYLIEREYNAAEEKKALESAEAAAVAA